MFKKIILSLILLSNVIFSKNENFDFKTDEFGQLIDEEGYIKPETYMNTFRYKCFKDELPDEDMIRYWSKRDKSKIWDNLRQLNESKKKWEDAGFGNQWAIDSEGYVDLKTYKSYTCNENFVKENPEIYREQVFAIDEWGDKWRKAGYGNQWDEDIEGYINPETYKDRRNNKLFFNNDNERYYDQFVELYRWGKACEEKTPKTYEYRQNNENFVNENQWDEAYKEKTPKNETSFFDKIKNFFKK